jgi:hypothetical protein
MFAEQLFALLLEGVFGAPVCLAPGELRAVPPAARVDHIIARGKAQGVVPAAAPPQSLHPVAAYLRRCVAWQAAFCADVAHAVPRSQLPAGVRVAVLRARGGLPLEGHRDALAADATWGWAQLCAAGAAAVTVHAVQGTHMNCIYAPHCAETGPLLRTLLD